MNGPPWSSAGRRPWPCFPCDHRLGAAAGLAGGRTAVVFGMLVPVIGLVQVGDQALADRYTYSPAIGLFMILA